MKRNWLSSTKVVAPLVSVIRPLVCACAIMLLAAGARANVLNVGLGGYTTIQAAIDAAAPGDEVSVADGYYTGPGNVNLNFGGKDIYLHSASGNPGACTIDAGRYDTCFYFISGETSASIVRGFTLTSIDYLELYLEGNGNLGDGDREAAGMVIGNSSPTISHCQFYHCATYSAGAGGVVCGGDNPRTGESASFSNCVFDTCATWYGAVGAMAIQQSNVSIINCAFWDNHSIGADPCILNGGGATITNCTFYNSETYYNLYPVGNITASALHDLYSVDPAHPLNNFNGHSTVTNCIFWYNSTYSSPQEATVPITPGPQTVVTYSDVQGGFPGTGNIDADPLFNGPLNNIVSLQASSPCINAGDNSAVPAWLTTDPDGNPRIQAGRVDMGAYECQISRPIANAGTSQTVNASHSGNPANDTALVTLDGSGSREPGGGSLTYAWSDGQGHASSAVNPQFSLPVGTYTFTLTVTGTGGLTDSSQVTVTVIPALNRAPVLNLQATAAVNIGCPVTVPATATDADGDSLVYSLASSPSWATINSSTGLVTLNPPAGTSGSFIVTVKATDPYGASDQKSATVSVCPIIVDGVTLSRAKNGDLTVQFNVRNTDGTNVNTVSINSSTLKGSATKSALPIVFTQLKQGVAKTVQLKFSGVPSGQAQFIVNGTSSSGPVNANITVNVP